MPFERPSLADLISRAQADIETRVDGSDAQLRRSFERAVAYALAGLAHGLHGHLFYLSKQILPDTCDEDMLKRWASVLDVVIRDASKAVGTINVTGTNGSVMPAGTKWARADGVEFETDADATISGGAASADVTAVETGEDGNTDAASPLTIVSPVAGIDSSASVDGDGLTGGADVEDADSLRPRVLDRLRIPPSGGGPGDYVKWALEVSGVTRAWEYANELGLGTVVVRFAVDGEASPIPSGAKVTEVQEYIDALAPITADVTVAAPTAYTLDMTIDLKTDDTAAIRAAVELELESFLTRVAEPGATIKWSQLNEAISLATGETDHTLTIPAADVVLTTGQLPVLGTITWT